MKGKQYDYKEAYNKNLTPKARLHYLENARHDQDAPTNMCSPNHYDSPLDFFGGNIAASALGASNAMSQVMKARQAQASNTGAESAVQPMTNVTPAGSSLVNPFNPQAQAVASGVFGNQQMKQNAVCAPAMFKDQTGDGKITQADVIKARVEGYKK